MRLPVLDDPCIPDIPEDVEEVLRKLSMGQLKRITALAREMAEY
jgi:hypothetical protein